jgi:DNA-binding MarR family transcriptional regulator
MKANRKVEPMLQNVSLDELISLNRFDSESDRLVGLVIYVSAWLDSHINDCLKKYDITRPQFNLIRILYNNHPQRLSTGVITARMIDKTSNVTRLADRLIPRGIMVRVQNEENRRIHELCLTPKGVKLSEELDAVMRENVWSIPTSKLNDEEIQQLIQLLYKLKGIGA